MRHPAAAVWTGAISALLVFSTATTGQSRAVGGQPSPCLRFAFGVWTPSLNWEEAGHVGKAEANGQAARRLRDSIFLQMPGSTVADGMVWDDKSGGRRVFVFPAWWPAGIVIQFDSAAVSGDTLRGVAEAMVADGAAPRPAARVRALRVACGNSR